MVIFFHCWSVSLCHLGRHPTWDWQQASHGCHGPCSLAEGKIAPSCTRCGAHCLHSGTTVSTGVKVQGRFKSEPSRSRDKDDVCFDVEVAKLHLLALNAEIIVLTQENSASRVPIRLLRLWCPSHFETLTLRPYEYFRCVEMMPSLETSDALTTRSTLLARRAWKA